MLEETEKAISSASEISKRIRTTFFNLIRYMDSYRMEEYIIGNYAFTLKKLNCYYMNHNTYYNEAIFRKIKREKTFFGKEKITVERCIYSFVFNLDNNEGRTITYEIVNSLDISEIQDAINFFLLFNEDIASKANLMIEHEDEMKAFDELLKNNKKSA